LFLNIKFKFLKIKRIKMKIVLAIIAALLTNSLFGAYLEQDDTASFWDRILSSHDSSLNLCEGSTNEVGSLNSSSESDAPSYPEPGQQPATPAQTTPGTPFQPLIAVDIEDGNLVAYFLGSTDRFRVYLPPELSIVYTPSSPAFSAPFNSPNQQHGGAFMMAHEKSTQAGKKRPREEQEHPAYTLAPRLTKVSQTPTFDRMAYCIYLGAGGSYAQAQSPQQESFWQVQINDPALLNSCINYQADKAPVGLNNRAKTLKTYFTTWSEKASFSTTFLGKYESQFQYCLSQFETLKKPSQDDQPKKKHRNS
jgi:hypothetical protein